MKALEDQKGGSFNHLQCSLIRSIASTNTHQQICFNHLQCSLILGYFRTLCFQKFCFNHLQCSLILGLAHSLEALTDRFQSLIVFSNTRLRVICATPKYWFQSLIVFSNTVLLFRYSFLTDKFQSLIVFSNTPPLSPGHFCDRSFNHLQCSLIRQWGELWNISIHMFQSLIVFSNTRKQNAAEQA